MVSSYKPAGYNDVSPYLIVDGAGETIEFLVRVFGAVELRRYPNEAGKLLHSEVRIGDTVV
ncbi:MAG: VOC family protein, partial [Planctomycetia bacterium]